MSELLLTTKLQMPPSRPNLVIRPRLFAQLDAGLGYALMLVSAPPGFGKSTVVSEWIRHRLATAHTANAGGVSWLALDEDDNDVTRFLTYLSTAMDRWHPGLADMALALLRSPEPPLPRTILTLLINSLSHLPMPQVVGERTYLLILDDYHLIHTAAIHDAIAFLVDHSPPQLQLLLTSRIDPPLPLMTWRARGQLAELRAADLRFTAAEASAFFNETMGLMLAPADVAALEVRTEGWAAGLQLAALALRGRTDQERFLQEFTGGHRYILGYLVDEVLARQPAAVQQFLLHTAVLERLSGALCDAVTELLDSQARLEALHRTNLFTIALDEHGEWYRYHHLFRDALRLRLQQTQPDLIPTLHQRASIWYESAGLLDEAIDHAIAAADLQRAGDLIVNAFLGLWKRGELGVLRRWIENLPAVALDTDPALAFWAGTLFCYTGQLDLAERRLDRAEAHFRAAQAVEPDSMDQRLGRVAVLQGMLAARRGLVTEAFARAEQAFALLPADDLVFRGGVYPLLGLAHLIRGDLIAAQQAYEQAAEVARHIDHWFLLTGALGRLVPVQLALGRLHAAAATCRQVLALPIVQSGGVPAAGYAHVGLAEVYYQWNDLTTAADHATTGVALGETSSIADLLYNAVLTCAKVQGALGARAEALAMIQRGHELAPQVGGAHLARRVQAMEALVQLRLGQVAAAAHLAHLRTATEAPDPLVAEFERLVEARWRLATGEPAGAVAILQPLLPAAETAQRQGSMIEILALLARAQAAHNEAATAVATLTRALTLAEPEGYIRLFVDEGPALADLLRAVGRQGSAAPLRPYLGRLLTAFADPPLEQAKVPGPGVAQSLTPDTALIEPLSEREQEVLQLVAEGASNEQIATALVISIHTVRKHMSNILGKLDVTSRTEAVAHARRLGLL